MRTSNTIAGVLASLHRPDAASIELLDLDSGERLLLDRGGSYPLLTPSGHLLYTRQGTVFAAPFDARRRALSRSPVPVLQDVANRGVDGGAEIAVGRELLVYRRGADAEIPAARSRRRRCTLARLLPSTSRGGGSRPLWAATGELFFVSEGQMMTAVATDTSGELWLGEPERGLATPSPPDAGPDAAQRRRLRRLWARLIRRASGSWRSG